MPRTAQKSLCVEHLATNEHPFHFLDSGLPNVFLVGIKFFYYDDGRKVAEIPALKPLMKLIARDLIERPDSLSGDEIRFLRKRLGKKAVDFAKLLGIDAATLSRYENGPQQPSESHDKLIRLLYVLMSDDSEFLPQVRPVWNSLLSAWKAGPTQIKIVKRIHNNEWSDVSVAA